MKHFYKISIFLLGGLCLSGCTKDKEDFILKHNKYIIELTNDLMIHNVSVYNEDTLNYSMRFIYNTNSVILTKTDEKNNITRKGKYFLNTIGLADSLIDSAYINSRLYNITISKFRYNINGYKIFTDVLSREVSTNPVSYTSKYSLAYEIVDGNVKKVNINDYCYDYYEYTALNSKIDIVSFIGNFNGKKNTKLLKSYNSGCHFAPSTTPSSNEYDYKLNSDGLVSERVEIYTHSFHISESKPKIEKITATFEYIFD
jgi:hypothetical protein